MEQEYLVKSKKYYSFYRFWEHKIPCLAKEENELLTLDGQPYRLSDMKLYFGKMFDSQRGEKAEKHIIIAYETAFRLLYELFGKSKNELPLDVKEYQLRYENITFYIIKQRYELYGIEELRSTYEKAKKLKVKQGYEDVVDLEKDFLRLSALVKNGYTTEEKACEALLVGYENEKDENKSIGMAERKTFNKKDRLLIYKKYNGHCAYCGMELPLKDLQVDHIVSLKQGGTNTIDNANPSCRLCNHYKRSSSIDVFRNYLLGGLIKRLRKIYIFRVAEKYGMIEIKEWDKKFYYEIHKQCFNC